MQKKLNSGLFKNKNLEKNILQNKTLTIFNIFNN